MSDNVFVSVYSKNKNFEGFFCLFCIGFFNNRNQFQ